MSATLQRDDLVLEPTTGADGLWGWGIVLDGERVGTAALRHESRRTYSVRWNTGTHELSLRTAIKAIPLVLEYAFNELKATRVEARVPVDRDQDLRAASISGLRREGIMRTYGDVPQRAIMARLIDDPPVSSQEGFIALLNAGLPTKRVIGQGILRNEAGEVLLCRLTYKKEWDLPGGVVEVGESPATGLVREIQEEFGVTVTVQGLVTINWLPAWRGWDDACVFVFDLGTVPREWANELTLQATEIAGVEWCDQATWQEKATAAATELLNALQRGPLPPYREAPKAAE